MTFDADVIQAVKVLKQGGVILYPTDTVWGLGCDSRCENAVRRIFEIKRRADSKAMISLVNSIEALTEVVGKIPPAVAMQLKSAERPLTVVYEVDTKTLASSLYGSDNTIAIRICHEPFCEAVCKALGAPLVSTSANISGMPTPAAFSEINPALFAQADYVAHNRRDDNEKSRPSRIIKVAVNGDITVIRQ